jgi:hypothetical protein
MKTRQNSAVKKAGRQTLNGNFITEIIAAKALRLSDPY